MENINHLNNLLYANSALNTALNAYQLGKSFYQSITQSPEIQFAQHIYDQFKTDNSTMSARISKGQTKSGKAARRTSTRSNSATTRKFLPNVGRNRVRGQPRTSTVQIGVQTAPVSAGFSLPPSYFKRSSGQAQQNADIGGMFDSERIEFSDIYSVSVATGSGSAIDLFPGTSSGTDAELSPNNISARLASITEVYQYYAFRDLIITYIPAVATSTPGLLAFGVYQDIDNLTITPTYQQVMEMTPAMSCAVWGTSSMRYVHKGTKLWETTGNFSAPSDQFIQALLFGVGFNTAVSTTYGKIHICGIMDVYKPSFILTGVASTSKKRLLLERERYSRFLRFEAAEKAEREKKETRQSLIKDLPTVDEDEPSIDDLEDLRQGSGFTAEDIEQLLHLSESLVAKHGK